MAKYDGAIIQVLIFPRPWPPEVEEEIYDSDQGVARVSLIADPTGRLGFQVYSADVKEYWFQPIVIEGRGRAIVAFAWTSEDASLRLNGQDVLLDADAHGKAFILKTSDDPVATKELVIDDVDFSTVKSEAEDLFLRRVVDIDCKVLEDSRYSVINAAAMLRQLFVDSSPLVHVVNRSYSLKLEFEIPDSSGQPSVPEGLFETLDVSQFPGAKTVTTNLQGFLNTPCFMSPSETATVRDVIKACANAKGGVHYGKAKNASEELVLEWDRTTRFGGKEPSQRSIAGICRVALRGLKPLVDAITS